MKFEEVSTQLIQIPNSHNGFYSVRSIPNLSLLRIVAKYPQRIIALLYICLAILNKNTICFVNSQSFRMTRKTNLALRTNSKHTQVSVCNVHVHCHKEQNTSQKQQTVAASKTKRTLSMRCAHCTQNKPLLSLSIHRIRVSALLNQLDELKPSHTHSSK